MNYSGSGCGGNRFMCGMRRFDKHRTDTPDKPSNQQLHDENNKRLQELMNIRQLQDKGSFAPIPQSATNIIQNIPTNYLPLRYNSVSNTVQTISTINPVNKIQSERVIDFDSYMTVD